MLTEAAKSGFYNRAHPLGDFTESVFWETEFMTKFQIYIKWDVIKSRAYFSRENHRSIVIL